MRLMRLIFLVVPILAVTFNTKSGKKKQQELDLVTEHVQTLDIEIEQLRTEQQNAERTVKDGKNTRNRNILRQRKEALLNANKNLEDAIKKKNGTNYLLKDLAVDKIYLFPFLIDIVEMTKFNQNSRNFIREQKSELISRRDKLQMELDNKNTPNDVKPQKKKKLEDIKNMLNGQYLLPDLNAQYSQVL